MNRTIYRDGLPAGWTLSGTDPQNYKVQTKRVDGNTLLFIAQIEPVEGQETIGFGSVGQVIGAGKFVGKRIQLSALMKVSNVPDWSWAGLWMRIDGSDETFVAFDNMYERRLNGTTGWVECSIVLDVSVESAQIAFGILLHGAGEAAVNNMQLSIVSEEINPTKNSMDKSLRHDIKPTIAFEREEAVNLSFED